MLSCHVIEIVTPKKFVLNGLWFGPPKPKRVIIWAHGLTSSAFSMLHVVEQLVGKGTAVLTFNNRGFGTINSIKRRVGKRSKSIVAGAAHEVFTECEDDIQGAVNFARKRGGKKIYVAGHSTGCQKAVYWAHTKKGGRGVRGLILLAPVSDYADVLKHVEKGKLTQLVKLARTLVKKGRPHQLIVEGVKAPWGGFFLCDAQRFLSLYTPDSRETMFSYEQPKKDPRIFKSVQVPMLVLWAGKDEYADRPAKKIVAWFEKSTRTRLKAIIVPKVGHSFRGAEKQVARAIRGWIAKIQT